MLLRFVMRRRWPGPCGTDRTGFVLKKSVASFGQSPDRIGPTIALIISLGSTIILMISRRCVIISFESAAYCPDNQAMCGS